MSGHDIATRMKDYFGRQIAWFDELLAEPEEFDTDLEEGALEAFAQRQQAQARATKDLEDEFWALLKEWEATADIAESERGSIRDLARQAEEKANILQARCDKGASKAGELAASVEEASNQLHKGKSALDKFRAQAADGPNFVDRKA